MTPSIPWQSEKTLNFPISSWPHCNAVGSTSNAVGTNPSGNAVGISCPSDIPPLTHTVDPYDGAPRMHEYKSLCKDKKDSCRISIKRHHKRCDEQTVHGNVDVSAIHSLFDFLLRRLIIKCVCYFPEFVSFKALREISCERIWVNLNRFGNPFWHPFGEKLGPFWWVGSRPHFGSLLELFFWIFGAPGPSQKEPLWKPFRFMLPSRGALTLKTEDFGGVWLQSLFLKRFYTIFGGVLDSENVDFAWEG